MNWWCYLVLKLSSDKSYEIFLAERIYLEMWKGIIASCDVSPVAMFKTCYGFSLNVIAYCCFLSSAAVVVWQLWPNVPKWWRPSTAKPQIQKQPVEYKYENINITCKTTVCGKMCCLSKQKCTFHALCFFFTAFLSLSGYRLGSPPLK